MTRTLPLLIAGLLALARLGAQDETIFNHYVQNPIILNPAAAGFDDSYRASLNARAQWSGFEDSPKTVALRVNGPVGESFGIGASLFSESAAQLTRLKGQLDVAFRFQFGRKVKDVAPFRAAFGFFTLFQRLNVDGSVLANAQQDLGDDNLMAFVNGENQFDAGVGFYGTYQERIFGGLTINNLVSNRLENISGNTSGSNTINYTFLLGQRFRVEELNVNLTPSVMLRNVVDAPFMMDFNLQAGFLDDQFIAGLSYRYLGAMGLLLGTEFSGLQLYYSYDLGFGGFQQYNNGSHEFTVGYTLSRGDIRERRRRKVAQEREQRR